MKPDSCEQCLFDDGRMTNCQNGLVPTGKTLEEVQDEDELTERCGCFCHLTDFEIRSMMIDHEIDAMRGK